MNNVQILCLMLIAVNKGIMIPYCNDMMSSEVMITFLSRMHLCSLVSFRQATFMNGAYQLVECIIFINGYLSEIH